ncbi:MAG: hypothetical protein JWP12_2029 [Bacteroidetes bacterium]|nr:hypothetical protein [Bacteroidota bacterium]
MRDVFYTLLVVWIIWRIMNSVNNIKTKVSSNASKSQNQRRAGETTVDYVPPKAKSKYDDAGEYVDYEEVK